MHTYTYTHKHTLPHTYTRTTLRVIKRKRKGEADGKEVGKTEDLFTCMEKKRRAQHYSGRALAFGARAPCITGGKDGGAEAGRCLR